MNNQKWTWAIFLGIFITVYALSIKGNTKFLVLNL
jgi:hypothetical protein